MQTHENFPVVSAGRFITRICAAAIFLFAVAGILSTANAETELPVLVEAEGFADTGGWVIDPQFMDLMGSPYLLAHGLGVPVSDARTEVAVPKAGRYRVWVRTKDWVARGEPNIDLFLEHRGVGVEMEGNRIRAVLAQEIRTGKRIRIAARWFADCTGDACIGALAGADFDMQEKNKMGPCNLWNVCECKDTNAINTAAKQSTEAVPFPRCPWALDLSDKPFPVSHFNLQHHDGETWREILPAVEENDNPVWSATFAPVKTKYLRLVITQTPHNISRVWEVEFYQPLKDEKQ